MSLTYEYGTPGEWEKGVERFTLERDEEELTIKGPCPRCGHLLEKVLSPFLSAVYGAPALGQDSNEMRKVTVTCNCVCSHPGAPDGKHGCGAWGGVCLQI